MADLLNPDALHHNLDQLDGWSGTTSGIRKTYALADERAAEAFIQRVARLADAMNHHPEVDHHGESVTLTLVTHSAGGVTQLDLDLAQRIEEALGDPDAASPRREA